MGSLVCFPVIRWSIFLVHPHWLDLKFRAEYLTNENKELNFIYQRKKCQSTGPSGAERKICIEIATHSYWHHCVVCTVCRWVGYCISTLDETMVIPNNNDLQFVVSMISSLYPGSANRKNLMMQLDCRMSLSMSTNIHHQHEQILFNVHNECQRRMKRPKCTATKAISNCYCVVERVWSCIRIHHHRATTAA